MALMVEAQVGLWRMVETRGSHRHRHADASRPLDGGCGGGCGGSLAHALGHHALHHGGMNRRVHLLLDGIAYRGGHRLVEEDGAVGLQPLLGEESAHRPMPETAHGSVALEGELLGESILELFLEDVHVIRRQVVLVHQHAVLDVLVTAHRREVIALAAIAQLQSRNQVVSSVSAREGGSRELSPARLQVELAVREAILIDILVVGEHVYLPT